MAFDLVAYLTEEFPALVLGDALFYTWPIGIRFELGGRARTTEEFAEVRRRGITLFEATFIPEDTCIVVSQEWDIGNTPNPEHHPLWMVSDFAINQVAGIRQPSCGARIQGLDGIERSSYTLTWFEQSGRDLDYASILSGFANADHARFPALYGAVHFLNPRTSVIMHMYDDRGLDIIANSKLSLAALYRDFNEWILDHDRVRIDSTFRA